MYLLNKSFIFFCSPVGGSPLVGVGLLLLLGLGLNIRLELLLKEVQVSLSIPKLFLSLNAFNALSKS